MLVNTQIVARLKGIAARLATESPFGWASPDCEAIEEAIRVIEGRPAVRDNGHADAVLAGSPEPP